MVPALARRLPGAPRGLRRVRDGAGAPRRDAAHRPAGPARPRHGAGRPVDHRGDGRQRRFPVHPDAAPPGWPRPQRAARRTHVRTRRGGLRRRRADVAARAGPAAPRTGPGRIPARGRCRPRHRRAARGRHLGRPGALPGPGSAGSGHLAGLQPGPDRRPGHRTGRGRGRRQRSARHRHPARPALFLGRLAGPGAQNSADALWATTLALAAASVVGAASAVLPRRAR